MSKLNWLELLPKERFKSDIITKNPEEVSTFQLDADRIIFSSAFRRLKSKTQVFPFPRSDYHRTRLSHTIEVSTMGRHIGCIIARHFMAGGFKDWNAVFNNGITAEEVGEIVGSACLAHDLGNPPFGHSGEDAIRDWFQNYGLSIFNKLQDREEQKNDFLNFDGNAQGFRIITKTQGWRNQGGLRLTYATLGAFSKYPNSSSNTKKPGKFGFMFSETREAKDIFLKLGLGTDEENVYNRHPLAYLTEAADDICYLATDIEDAVKSKKIKFKEGEDLLMPLAKNFIADAYSSLDGKDDKIAYLRMGAIASLSSSAINTFVDHYDSIMNAAMNGTLLENSEKSYACNKIRDYCRSYIYTDREKREKEVAGYKVITDLMNLFSDNLNKRISGKQMSSMEERVCDLFPIDSRLPLPNKNQYRCLQAIVDYISGMTDNYAVSIHSKIFGKTFEGL